MTENFKMEQFDQAVLNGTLTWWQMELPSGDVYFGEMKAKMLGYPDEMFKTYMDFVNLLHPEDSEKAMQAMRDHISGKNNFYETVYRIKNKDGQYIKFYDCGRIIKKDGEKLVILGFVMKIQDEKNIIKQMEDFKKLILDGNPSIIDLVSKIR